MPDNNTLLSQMYIKVNGADAPEDLMAAMLEITVENSLHMPDVATLVIHDPRLEWVDDDRLGPGKTLEIEARGTASTGQRRTVFDGEIVELEPEYGASTHRLVVRAFDRLHRLGRGLHVRSFQNVTDSDLAQQIAQECGLQAQVEATNQVHAYAFQNNETNLNFLRKRAAGVGYLLYAQGRDLSFKPLRTDGPRVQMQWGVNLSEFRPRLTTIDQVSQVSARGWDPAQRREVIGQATTGHGGPHTERNEQGGQVAQNAFNIQARYLVSSQPIRSQAAADRLAQAVLDRQSGRFIEAEGVCAGDPAIVAGANAEVSRVGNRFSGTYFVTAATHTYTRAHGYQTHFSISGYTPSTLLSLLRADEPTVPSAGLVIGVVTDNQDPDGWGRVKIKYPWLSAEHASDWARVVIVGGGARRGIEFLPEVNDEVLVGFEMGDIHHPYVLGGLWNGQDAPPKRNSEAISGGHVQQRFIRSRSGHTITFDDSDSGAKIVIEDKSGNTITLDSMANKLIVDIKGDTSLKARGNLTLEAQGQVQIKGMGVTIDGQAATVDVKGSLINLNS